MGFNYNVSLCNRSVQDIKIAETNLFDAVGGCALIVIVNADVQWFPLERHTSQVLNLASLRRGVKQGLSLTGQKANDLTHFFLEPDLHGHQETAS